MHHCDHLSPLLFLFLCHYGLGCTENRNVRLNGIRRHHLTRQATAGPVLGIFILFYLIHPFSVYLYSLYVYNSSVFAFIVSISFFWLQEIMQGIHFFCTTVPLFSDCMAGGKPI